MWIFLLILALLAIIITVILLLPVKVILKNNEKDALILRYKFLFRTFGENPDPNDPIIKALKDIGGLTRLEETVLQQKNASGNGKGKGAGNLKKTISESYEILTDLLKQLLFLLKNCTVSQLHLQICCADDDPAEAAIQYGLYNAATATFLSVLDSLFKIRRRGCHIDIGCDFQETNTVLRYKVVLTVPAFRVVTAFWRAAMAEVKRKKPLQQNQSK